MSKVPVDLAPEVRADHGRHPRSPAADANLQLARAYLAARRALWAAGGEALRDLVRAACPDSDFARGDDSPEAFERAALAADGAFAVSRRVPGLERELAAATRARNALVASAFALAQRYVNRRGQGQSCDGTGMRLRADRDDLFQNAAEALLRAADLFDPDRGTTWSTYAVWWIRYGAQLEEHRSPPVRVPGQALAAWRKAEAHRAKVAAETGVVLTWPEVCEALGKPASHAAVLEGVARALRAKPAGEEEISEIDALAGTHLAESLRAISGTSSLADPQASPEDALARAEVLGAVRAMIDAAAAPERVVLAGLAGEGPANLRAVARAADVPQSRAAAVRRRAVEGARERLARVA